MRDNSKFNQLFYGVMECWSNGVVGIMEESDWFTIITFIQ